MPLSTQTKPMHIINTENALSLQQKLIDHLSISNIAMEDKMLVEQSSDLLLPFASKSIKTKLQQFSRTFLQKVASAAIKEEDTDILNALVLFIPELLDNNSTLLMEACESLKIKSVKLLLQNGANPNLQDPMGNTPAICALHAKGYERRLDKDLDGLTILKILKKFNADFTLCNKEGDTVLIKAVYAKLPYSTQYIMNTLAENGLLIEQLDHKNHEHTSTRELISKMLPEICDSTNARKYDKPNPSLVLKYIVYKVQGTGKYDSDIGPEIENLLLDVDQKTIKSLVSSLFIPENFHPEDVPCSLRNQQYLLEGRESRDSWGSKLFTLNDVKLLELFIVAGTNTSSYSEFVAGLRDISMEKMSQHEEIHRALIFIDYKKQILNLIEASNCLSNYEVTEKEELSSLVKKLAIHKFFFLIKKNIAGIDIKTELDNLTDFIEKNYKVDQEELSSYLASEDVTHIERFNDYKMQISRITKNSDTKIDNSFCNDNDSDQNSVNSFHNSDFLSLNSNFDHEHEIDSLQDNSESIPSVGEVNPLMQWCINLYEMFI